MESTRGKEDKITDMQEASRIILGLRAAGWDDKSITDFILWIETGDERYKPAEKKKDDLPRPVRGFLMIVRRDRLIFEKTMWINYAIQVNLRGIRQNIVDKRAYLK